MKNKFKILTSIVFILILIFAVYFIFISNRDEGKYDYCVEWEGFNNGTLHRDSLLYTCYNLATSSFYCDYEVNKATQILMIKPIINVTKNDEGFITQINYDQPNYFNCTRWLKSKEIK